MKRDVQSGQKAKKLAVAALAFVVAVCLSLPPVPLAVAAPDGGLVEDASATAEGDAAGDASEQGQDAGGAGESAVTPESEAGHDAVSSDAASSGEPESGEPAESDDADADADTDGESANANDKGAQRLSGKVKLADDVVLKVAAKDEHDALPEGAKLVLSKVDDREVLEAFEAAAVDDADFAEGAFALAACDIAFESAQGKTVWPSGDVRIVLTCSRIDSEGDVAVLHAKKAASEGDEPKVEVVGIKKSQIERGIVEFDAKDFSPYALVYTPKAVDENSNGGVDDEAADEDGVGDDADDDADDADDDAEDADSGSSAGDDAEGGKTTVEDADGTTHHLITSNELDITGLAAETGEADGVLLSAMSSRTPLYAPANGATYHTDIAPLLVDATLQVDGQDVKPGETAAVKDGVTYTLKLKFKETTGEQFSNEGPLTYVMPAGFDLPDDFTTTLEIGLGRRGRLYNPVSYDAATRELRIEWDRSSPALFKYFSNAATASFELDLQGVVDLTQTQIVFSDDASINVVKQDLHNAKVEKTGVFNSDTGRIDYTVTVISDGTTENLVLTDEPGIALVYDDMQDIAFDRNASVSADGEAGSWAAAGNEPVITNAGSSFRVSIPSMADGEKLAFTYSCFVDVNNIETSGHATFEETGNTATIAGDEYPEDNAATHWEDKIAYSDLGKDVTGVSSAFERDSISYRTISWQIDTNDHPEVSFANTTISDTIGEDIQSLCAYAGEGIVVTVYDRDGAVVDTRNVTWADMGVNPAVDKSWTYHIPADDIVPYHYVVTYDTEINMDLVNSGGVDVYVTNYAAGKGGEDVAMEIVHPEGAGVAVSKKAKSYTVGDVETNTPGTVEWEMTIHLENGWWDKCQLLTELYSDSVSNTGEVALSGDRVKLGLPNQWVNGRCAKEVYDSVEVVGLQEGESYKVNSQARAKWDSDLFSIEFFKSEEQDDANRGLNAPNDGTDARDIRIILKTTYDPKWITDARDLQLHGGAYNHINIMDVGRYYSAADPSTPRDAKSEAGARAVDKISPRGTHTTKRVLRGYESAMTPSNYAYQVIQDWTKNPQDGAAINYPIDNYANRDPESGDPNTLYPISGSKTGTGYGGNVYPLLMYQVSVTGVETDEPLVINDAFDTSLFKLWTVKTRYTNGNGKVAWSYFEPVFGAYDTGDWLSASDAHAVMGRSETYPCNEKVLPGATVELTDTGARFTFNEVPKKADGSYYNSYVVQYYLIPKDAEALRAIALQALDNGQLTGVYTASYTNTATSRGESDEGIVTFPLTPDFKPVGKTMTQVADTNQDGSVRTDASGNPVMTNQMDCEIRLNPGKMRLNDGVPMYMTDTYSSTLSIDFTTIEIATDPAEAKESVSYDFSGNVGTFLVPDETAVTIRYKATVLPESGSNGDVTPVWNEAAMLKFKDRVEQDVTFTSASSGEGVYPELQLYKYGAGHMETGLNGAVFKLYEATPVFETDAGGRKTVVDYTYKEMVTKGQDAQPITFTTGQAATEDDDAPADGYATIRLDQNLHGYNLQYSNIVTRTEVDEQGNTRERINWDADATDVHMYALEEVAAPEGYDPASFKYRFAIVREGMVPVYADYVFMDGEAMTVRNAKGTTELTITKHFEGNAAADLTEDEKAAITFTLENADGTPIQRANDQGELEDDPRYIDIPYTSFVGDKYVVTGLAAGDYRLVENAQVISDDHPDWTCETVFSWDGIEGDEVQITQEDIDAAQDFAVEVTNTYTKPLVSIEAAKRWQDPSGAAIAWPAGKQVTLDLYTYSDENGRSDEPVKSIVLDGEKDKQGEVRGGVALFDELPVLPEGVCYQVQERADDELSAAFNTTYMPTEGKLAPDAVKGVASIVNRQKSTSVTVSKSWANVDGTAAAPAGASATMRLYSYVSGSSPVVPKRVAGVDDVTVTGAPWRATFDNLPLVDKNGDPVTYVVMEVATTEGYQPKYPGNALYAADGETIVNRPESVDFTFAKQWPDGWPGEGERVINMEVGRRLVLANGETVDDVAFTCLYALTATNCTLAQGNAPAAWDGQSATCTWDGASVVAAATSEPSDDATAAAGAADATAQAGNAVQTATAGKSFRFTLADLPKYGTVDGQPGIWEYYVSEQLVDGYNTTYKLHGALLSRATEVSNGGVIINSPQTFGPSLPASGGWGMEVFYAIGIVIIAAVAFAALKKVKGVKLGS